MNQYRDFDNDPVRYNTDVGKAFLTRLHNSGRHYIPIIDAAIYVPNPTNASDALVFTGILHMKPLLILIQLPDLQPRKRYQLFLIKPGRQFIHW